MPSDNKNESSLSFDLVSSVIASTVLGSTTSTNPITSPSHPNHQQTSNQTSITNDKESLSLQTTTTNFKNFVSKSGPIFWFQDKVEDILTWQDYLRTSFWACLWAWLCINPIFFIILPNLAIIAILLSAYPNPNEIDSKEAVINLSEPHEPLPTNEPKEGSVDYLSNMQNIQIMMGRISIGSDLVKAQIVPYLDWSNPHYSLALLHLSLISSVIFFLIGPFIPWRWVLLIVGESVFFAQHPTLQRLMNYLTPLLPTQKSITLLERVISNDALPDHVIDSPAIRLVVCREHQRYGGTGPGWSDTFLDQSSDPRPWMVELPDHVLQPTAGLWAVQPPDGFQWIPTEGWHIDHTSSDLDSEGWHFVNGVASLGPSLRRRRWLRRAYQHSIQ
ncbi:Peroxin/Dysferlin domain-containing protein [Melampsora americana]|nr:Peroxin/Dysferlin domain-containing protein [Melampsora americana]